MSFANLAIKMGYCYISASTNPISMKFERLMRILIPRTVTWWKFNILQIQDGRWTPSWKWFWLSQGNIVRLTWNLEEGRKEAESHFNQSINHLTHISGTTLYLWCRLAYV